MSDDKSRIGREPWSGEEITDEIAADLVRFADKEIPCVCDPSGNVVAVVFAGSATRNRIVHCVNTHEKLVEALRLMSRFNLVNPNTGMCPTVDEYAVIDEALRAIGAKP